jgi:Tfp pilus assembly protein PilO
MPALSRRERRLIGLALVTALVIGGYVWLIEPQLSHFRGIREERIPAQEQVLAKRKALISQRSAYSEQLDEVTRAVDQAVTRLLPGNTPPLAASELQKLVKDLAGEANVEVKSERILAPVERGELLEIPVEITVSGGIRELVTLLYRLEGSTKILTLQDLKVRVISVSQTKDLLTTLTVSGFIIPSAPAPKEGQRPAGSPKG